MRNTSMRRKQLEKNPTPSWLFDVNANSTFDRRNVFSGSVYYPGCGFDSLVIHAYAGFAHSFIYVDYKTQRKDALRILPKFCGYSVVLMKELDETDLSDLRMPHFSFRSTDFYHPLRDDESIFQRLKSLRESFEYERFGDPKFYLWMVYSRNKITNPGHGPERFSLLYISEEAVSTYKIIYNANGLVPIAVTISGADIGFGGNWTLFEQRDAIFERIVMANQAGIPKYLFTDSRYDPTLSGDGHYHTAEPYWEKYTTRVPNRNFLSIWTTHK